MFPENFKVYETFKVEHANTERLKHSAIIYVQNLLNKNG